MQSKAWNKNVHRVTRESNENINTCIEIVGAMPLGGHN